MPHYLIEIAASPLAAEQIPGQPRARLQAVRAAATELGGHLDGCWFADGGEKVVALLHSPDDHDCEAVKRAFTGVQDGITVEVQPLLTLRELTDLSQGEDVLIRTELWSDPVDLSSDLSFPASDPPSWIAWTRTPIEEAH